MDSSLNNTLVAAVAFAATFLGVRAFAFFKTRRQARRNAALRQLTKPDEAPTNVVRPFNRSKRKRLERDSAAR
ncbi:MAG: hypothetical protein WBI20_06225 [Burkholderiaceae bacterium]